MSFAKAQDLLRLAQIAASRRGGISLEEICAEFGVSHRTAQRMTDALEATFANVETEDGEDRRKYWRLKDPHLARLQPRQETTVEALEIAVRSARDDSRLRHARALETLRDGLIAKLPIRDALRAETDVEAVLGALGQVARPGPRVLLKPAITDAVIEGLRGPFRLRVVYGSPEADPRIIEPHGLLLGPRSYLVARQPGRGDGFLNFRMDRIVSAEPLDESFAFSDGFSLAAYAARAFGSYQDSSQYGEIIWRFMPWAAARAIEFKFHPDQVLDPQPDGSLLVRFHAAGWLEMAWFLYQWGDAVEVLAPEGLRDLIEGHRRADFDSLP
jgi:predicted DNA-binding transcriptional regulator YafY